jgi:hypothetical protein
LLGQQPRASGNIRLILNVLIATLGGAMVPLFVTPPVMQKIASYSLMNWGLKACSMCCCAVGMSPLCCLRSGGWRVLLR